MGCLMGGVQGVQKRGSGKGRWLLAPPLVPQVSVSVDEDCSLFPPLTFGKPSLRPSADR